MLAGLLVERATDTELAGLRTRIERMRSLADAGDVDAYFWDHVQLQERMTEIAGNTTLKQMLDSLALRTLMLRHLSLTRPGRLAHSVDDQERLIQACEERDRELASALIARRDRAGAARGGGADRAGHGGPPPQSHAPTSCRRLNGPPHWRAPRRPRAPLSRVVARSLTCVVRVPAARPGVRPHRRRGPGCRRGR